jgi:hypothetical protein
MRDFKFEKENNKWYVVLPEWEGPKDDLEMVLGADTMLDILSQGEESINVIISEEKLENPNFILNFDKTESGGAWYKLSGSLFNFDVWLCEVTKFVFGYLPKKLYIV